MIKQAESSRSASSPKVFLVMTGFVCNNNCTMCSVRPKGLHYKPRSTKEITGDLSTGIKQGYVSVEFTGGEPTTRTDLVLLIAKAKQLGYRHIAMSSNARTISAVKFLKDLKKNGLTRITATLYSSSPGVHDAITRVPGSFKQTVQGIKNSLTLGIETSVNTVVFNKTVGGLALTGRLLAGLGVKYWTILDLIPDGYAAEDYALFSVSPGELYAVFKKVEPVVKKFDSVSFMDFPYCVFPRTLLSARNCNFICAKGRTEIINQVGYHPKRFQKKNSTYYDIHKIRVPKCETCAYRDECGGVWAPYPGLYGTLFIRPFTRKIYSRISS